METETRRTSRVVSNLLAFSRQSKMEMKPVNINQPHRANPGTQRRIS
ncbi:MAG: hypothetical protein MZV70_61370 [Desulfobacterales bacterium]|nr:hypothetical protein [Desulfobacterales bacterium]